MRKIPHRLLRVIHHLGVLGGALLSGRLFAQAPAEDIRGPRELIDIPTPEKSPLGLYLSIVAGLLLLLLGWYIYRKLSLKKTARTPLTIAFASLNELANQREVYTAEIFAKLAGQAVRTYSSDQFGIVAPRRTTEEFLDLLAKESTSPIGKEGTHLQTFLGSCDLAKFAGSSLSTRQRDELLQAARDFITASSAPSA